MRRLLVSIIIIFLTYSSANAVTYNSDPKIFITELVVDALKILSDKNLSQEDKIISVRKIAIENVDINALGMYTIGDIRKTLSPELLTQYNDLFKEYFLKSLTSRLTEYSSNKFEVLEADKKNVKYTIVKSKILKTSEQPEVRIDWRVYTKDPLKPLIRDLIVEGLSLARTQKEEFISILSSNDNNIEILFSKLQEFISK